MIHTLYKSPCFDLRTANWVYQPLQVCTTIGYGCVKLTLYSANTILQCHIEVCTLAIDGWAITFGTARRDLGGAAARPGPSSLYQM